MLSDPRGSFVRKLLEDNRKIESVCRVCGHQIVASVSEGLADLEQSHVAQCTGATRGG
jgi:hypothetical protein